MNSAANIGGVRFFIESIWPGVLERAPRARFLVVGRDPPASLRTLSQVARNVEFTGAVDDVRPFVRASHVSVIPLQVGGGTRIKAFEAMALGCPVVSTTVGIEGLDVDPDHHYLREDEPAGFAAAVAGLLADDTRRQSLSNAARALVEDRFGHTVAARAFESICVSTLARTTGRSAAPAA
jgi:polysaccharide biosynthesis protein PslH